MVHYRTRSVSAVALLAAVALALALLAVLTTAALEPEHTTAVAQSNPAEVVDACVRREMADRGIFGAQIAVAQDGEIVFERAYGRKHRDRPDPVDTHTQFRIGSTTKALTAFAIMQQVDEGTIDLDAPITEYLEGFELAEPGQAEAITVRDLLRHTSGLHDTSAMDETDLFGPKDPEAMGRWVDEQRGSTPYAPPGRFWNYSSANYMYAGHILELAAGMSYPDYMDSHVFAPAGMADSTLHAEQAVERGNFAYGHFHNPFSGQDEIYTLDDANNWARHPTGYANSTAGDLVRFASLMMAGGDGVLSEESVREMQSRQQYRDLRVDQYYGLGTFVEYFRGREMIHHDGGAWGWSATLKWIPEAGVAVATVSNIYGGVMSSSTECALRAYVPPAEETPIPCRLDRDRWNDFVGTYYGSVNRGTKYTFEVTRPDPYGELHMRVLRECGATTEHVLTQDCALWTGSGEGSFQADRLGMITFIEDPLEPNVTWLRHRFMVGRMERGDGPAPTASPAPGPQGVLYVPRAETGAAARP